VAGIIIELNGLTKKYGEFTAVDHLDLSISKGEVFGLLGPNGAGKSTTILMILGLTEPDEGTVRVTGTDPVSQPVEVKKKVGYLPEDVGFYDRYTGLENLIFTGMLNGLTESESEKKGRELLEKVGLSEHIDKKTGVYSRGMRQRLGLADVLIKNPEVIILDEPIMGIDPSGVRAFLDMIVSLSKKEGITVLFSSHQLYQVQQVCDRVGLFVGGKLLADGDIASLSEKLFADSPYTIEAGVAQADHHLKDKLTKLDGVLGLKEKHNKIYMACSKDITSHISRTIIQSGYELLSLNKKEYGLDDIYYRYFEGRSENE
jgi:ABC-2 type transport system ATP-binding protein